jgi:DNA-binding CsgD family transcriptional regulator
MMETKLEVFSEKLKSIADLVSYISDSNHEIIGISKFLTLNTFAPCGAFAVYVMKLEDDGYLQLIDTFGQTEEQVKNWNRFPLSADVPGADAIKRNEIIWISDTPEWNDTFKDLNKFPGSNKMGAIIHVPISLDGNPIGILGIMCSKKAIPNPEDEPFLNIVSGLISLLFTNDSSIKKSHQGEIHFTRRQKTIISLIADGLTNNQIALELGFSLSTVRHETMRIYKILNVSGRKEAIAKALENNLIN